MNFRPTKCTEFRPTNVNLSGDITLTQNAQQNKDDFIYNLK